VFIQVITNENILNSESYELIGIYIQIQYVPYLWCWREFDVKLVYLLSGYKYGGYRRHLLQQFLVWTSLQI